MSEVIVAPDHFWREFKSDVAGSLSNDQRGEIERVLGLSSVPGGKKVSDLRLSFKWFFVRIAWGPEKRSPGRIEQEEKMHPVLVRRNLPMLASLYVGFVAFLFMAIALSSILLAYFAF